MPDNVINNIIREEGGFKKTVGGVSKFGITKRVLSAYLGYAASITEVKTLNIDTAREIYYRHYVVAPRLDTLPNIILPILTHISLRSGPKAAVKIVQKVSNAIDEDEPMSVDGIIGPVTRLAVDKAIKRMGDKRFNNALVIEHKRYYDNVANADSSKVRYIDGWKSESDKFVIT